MPPQIDTPALDVIHPSGERTRIPVDPLPFRIGRGPDNNLILRDNRASRAHAKISFDGSAFLVEDLASLHGTWVNGARIEAPMRLKAGDSVHFGFEDSYRLVFTEAGTRIHRMLDEISASSQVSGAASSLARLRALLELARSLQTTLAREEVLAAILDAALGLTGSARGFLLLRSGEKLEVKLGRDNTGSPLNRSDFNVPTTVIESALAERRDLLSLDLPGSEPESANGICIPLLEFPSIDARKTIAVSSQSSTIGVLYLEHPRARSRLSDLDRELLHTLALEASTAVANARLLEEERQKRLLEQELGLARQIQENLLPQKMPQADWFSAAGSSIPSAEIAGDYFDVHSIGPDAWAAIIADVSGKGIGAALLASLLQGAFLLASGLDVPLDAVLSKINTFLNERAHGEKYATLFCAAIHRSGSFMWSNAGHVEPILLSTDGTTRNLETTSMPLGLLPEAEFAIERLQLSPGDKIIAFSDGLSEAEAPNSGVFASQLPELLASCAQLSAQELHDRLIERLLEFAGALHDDVTVLVLQYRGESGS